jgi:hypothetical protein
VQSVVLWKWLGLSDIWKPPPPPPPEKCNPDQPYYFFGISFLWKQPHDLGIGTGLIFLSLILTLVTLSLRTWLFGPKNKDYKEQSQNLARPDIKLLVIVPIVAGTVLLGLLTVQRYHEHIVPFVSSLMVLFTIIIAVGAIVLTVDYNDYLFIKVHQEKITKLDGFWVWALPIMSVLVFASGLLSFGRNNLPALLVTDMLFTLVFIGVLAALVILPLTSISGELLYTLRSRVLGRARAFVGKFLIGFWHAALQLLVPFVLVRRGTWLTWILAAILVVLPIWPAAKLYKYNQRALLAILWVAYGALMLALPWLTSQPYPNASSSLGVSHFFDWPAATGWFPSLLDWFRLKSIFPAFIAGLVGAAISCLWFGWYLGICSLFNGHNNEVGGAARIEKFKQFIRFKVTKDGLTGYVIAVDDVSLIGQQDKNGNYYDGRSLKPKLIDVFHLELKK